MNEMYKYLKKHSYISENKKSNSQFELSEERAECIANKYDSLLKKQREIIDKAIEDLKFYQSKAYDEENDIRYNEIQSTIDILEDKEV